MTNFEIAIILVLIAYGVIFGIVCAGLFNGTRRNKSGIEITNKILDCHDSRINGIVDRMDFLVQLISDQYEEILKNKKEGPKAGYGHIFNLKIASTPMSDDKVAIYTIDDLKDIWDKYGNSNYKTFDTNCFLIVDFYKNRIVVYGDQVE